MQFYANAITVPGGFPVIAANSSRDSDPAAQLLAGCYAMNCAALEAHATDSNKPAAPMPPPTHMVTMP